jgi:hypothetical protein
MLKQYFSNQTKRTKQITSVLVVLIVAGIGTYLLLGSHAATPYTSITANKGILSGGATTKTCSGASDGNCVVFGSAKTGNSLCGFKTGSPAISKVMVIWEENESSSSIIGNSNVPYMNQIATNCGYANNYWALTHPSLPNYMAMTSGVSYANSPWNGDCVPSDSGCTTSNASIFSQLGSSWKSYAETMPSNCGPDNSGSYAPKHNPAVYYTNIASACAKQDVPLGTTSSGNLLNDIQGGLPLFTTITPNLNDDWHDGSAQQADNWLKGWLPIITTGSDYQSGKLAILVVFDEGGGSGDNPSQTYATWLSPYTTPGTSSSTHFDNYSVLKTAEDLLGQPELGNAKNVTSMTAAFNL